MYFMKWLVVLGKIILFAAAHKKCTNSLNYVSKI